MVEDPKIAGQLLALKDLTRRFGTLHEAQKLQLCLWPRLIMPHSRAGSEAKIDMVGCSVTFSLITKGRAPRDFRKRAAVLAKNVRWLLGDHWKVKVVDGKRLFESGREAPWNPPKEA